MNILTFVKITSIAVATLLLTSTSAFAALLPRDLDGNPATVEALYDTELNVTWLLVPSPTTLDWFEAGIYANSLTVNGISNWRLPTVRPVDGVAINDGFANNGTTDAGTARAGVGWGKASELGNLFYVSLGNNGYCVPNDGDPVHCVIAPSYGLVNHGLFSTLEATAYWNDTQYQLGGVLLPFRFDMSLGGQGTVPNAQRLRVLVVHDGDVGSDISTDVPALPAWGLLALGGLLLGTAARRRRDA